MCNGGLTGVCLIWLAGLLRSDTCCGKPSLRYSCAWPWMKQSDRLCKAFGFGQLNNYYRVGPGYKGWLGFGLHLETTRGKVVATLLVAVYG